MKKELSAFAARLREAIDGKGVALRCLDGAARCPGLEFDSLALELFALQFKYIPAYRKICEAQARTPDDVGHWTQIPAVPTAAFKELELSSIPSEERTAVFHSSGTTGQNASRHFHCPASLELYEASLWASFRDNVVPDLRSTIYDLRAPTQSAIGSVLNSGARLCEPQHIPMQSKPLRVADPRSENKSGHYPAIFLAPPPEAAPHSSLVHMFETVRRNLGFPESALAGSVLNSGARLYEPQHIPMQSEPLRVAEPPSPTLWRPGPRSDNKSGHCPFVGNSGARLCEPQHIPMQSEPLRVADPRSENKSGHYPFVGKIDAAGRWTLDFDAVAALLNSSLDARRPSLLLGTAFSFVHLMDYLAEKHWRSALPPGSRVMETGGYKNRSRSLPKTELHRLISERLGVPSENIICEYGMSELSSQAYEVTGGTWQVTRNRAYEVTGDKWQVTRNRAYEVTGDKWQVTRNRAYEVTGDKWQVTRNRAYEVTGDKWQVTRNQGHEETGESYFKFPPWARARVISPETGREVAEGGTGLLQVFDLANVFSVMAIQTEDLGVRRGGGFELIGRARLAEPRGCSLMTA